MEFLIDRVRRHEGTRLTVYDDATGKPLKQGDTIVGHPTIGIGRCLSKKGITLAEANLLLTNDLNECHELRKKHLPWTESLSLARQEVLEEMIFQMGIGGVLAFKQMLSSLKLGFYGDAAINMLDSLWAKQTPARAKELASIMKAG